jgi:hypothetical protein
MRGALSIAAIGIGLFLAGSSARAHHSFAAEFDASKPVNLRGVVTRVEWINPHTWIHIDVKGTDGQVVKWMIEGGSPNSLFRRGVTKASLPMGTEIIVAGYQARSGTNRANGRDLTLPDGKKLSLGAPADAPPVR